MADEQAVRRVVVLGDSIAVHRGDPVDGYPTQTWAERLVLAFAPDAYRNRSATSPLVWSAGTAART